MKSASFVKEKKQTGFDNLRKNLLPVQPDDSNFVKLLKNSGFYAALVMAVLVSIVLAAVLLFVL